MPCFTCFNAMNFNPMWFIKVDVEAMLICGSSCLLQKVIFNISCGGAYTGWYKYSTRYKERFNILINLLTSWHHWCRTRSSKIYIYTSSVSIIVIVMVTVGHSYYFNKTKNWNKGWTNRGWEYYDIKLIVTTEGEFQNVNFNKGRVKKKWNLSLWALTPP